MGILSNLFSGGAEKLVSSLGGVLDNLITSKEEKEAAKLAIAQEINRHNEVAEAEVTKRVESELKDMADARNREIQIVTSDKAPLINKIIQPLLALLILGSCFLFWYMILFVDITEDKRVEIAGVTGSLTTLAVGVVQYFFGSSTGSAAKQTQLNKIANKEPLQ